MKNMKYKFKTLVSVVLITFIYSCSDTHAIETSLKVEGGQIEGAQNGSLKKFAGIKGNTIRTSSLEESRAQTET